MPVGFRVTWVCYLMWTYSLQWNCHIYRTRRVNHICEIVYSSSHGFAHRPKIVPTCLMFILASDTAIHHVAMHNIDVHASVLQFHCWYLEHRLHTSKVLCTRNLVENYINFNENFSMVLNINWNLFTYHQINGNEAYSQRNSFILWIKASTFPYKMWELNCWK